MIVKFKRICSFFKLRGSKKIHFLMSEESSTYQDLKLKMNNKEIDSMREEEQGPDKLGRTEVNTEIDLKSIEKALQDYMEQEEEYYLALYELQDEEILDAEKTLEINSILEMFENMDEDELDDYYYNFS